VAYKTYEIAGIGPVHIYKRRGAKSIRLSIDGEGKVRVTVPYWAPYHAAVTFARQRQQWIVEHKSQLTMGPLVDGQRIGMYHTLQLERDAAAERIRTRVGTGAVKVIYPTTLAATDETVQQAARTAAHKVLRREGEQLLPQRLRALAAEHGFDFRSVSVRNLKTRWGSCDSHQHITLNFFLMQVPWRLIDYVLVHELAHTHHLNHSPAFWSTVAGVLPDYKQRRKELKDHQPSVAVG
jgi:predicted metal-dependent hydrolase